MVSYANFISVRSVNVPQIINQTASGTSSSIVHLINNLLIFSSKVYHNELVNYVLLDLFGDVFLQVGPYEILI